MTDQTAPGIPEPEGSVNLIQTDYEVGQDNIETQIGPFGLDIHNPVFLISGLAIVAFVFFTLALPDQAASMFSAMFSFATKYFDWFLIGAADIVVIFALFLVVSPYGSVRLGGTEATPDYGYVGWFAMLFAAGMGIGLMFYGVSEPLTHFSTSLGETSVVCLIATDDEAFTYNRRLCRLATIQEHKMILKLAEHGMSEQSIAELMRVDVSTLRTKLRLLDGIAPEVAELLKDKRCPVASIRLLRQMKPARQLQVASLMVQMGTYTSRFVTTMLETSRPADRITVKNTRTPKVTPEQLERMQAEMAGLQERIKEIEGSLS